MNLAAVLESFGFGEKRCCHCHAPWFAGKLAVPDVSRERLCPACSTEFAAYTGPRCRHCGLPLPECEKFSVCPECMQDRPPWSGIACYGLYEGALRDVILRLKFDAELQLAWLLADILLQASACLPRPDVIVPVPQYVASLRKRGFNQTRELARRLGRLSGLEVDYRSLKKIRAGRPQEGLGATERRSNLRGAFEAGPQVRGRRIWLLDDVVTTGSTGRHATDALLFAGASEVYLLACARTAL